MNYFVFVLVVVVVDIHWCSDLVYVDMGWYPTLGCHMGSYMVNLRDIHWESGRLVQKNN